MMTPSDFPTRASDTLLAAVSALLITGVLFATAIIPATPALAAPIQIAGGLA